MPELLTVAEVAEMLKLKKKVIYQLRAEHKIPYVMIGKSIRFRKEDLEQWLDENTVKEKLV